MERITTLDLVAVASTNSACRYALGNPDKQFDPVWSAVFFDVATSLTELAKTARDYDALPDEHLALDGTIRELVAAATTDDLVETLDSFEFGDERREFFDSVIAVYANVAATLNNETVLVGCPPTLFRTKNREFRPETGCFRLTRETQTSEPAKPLEWS
ncbi:MAG: hypothetical protein OXF75_04340 [Acidimicrobiaceae bacterium]|nr:hypothetical protein [Acidimicrobiaceae bacterium]